MRATCAGALVAAVVLCGSAPARAGSLKVQAIGLARGIYTEGRSSWLEGGYGRLTVGAQAPGDSVYLGRAQAHVGLEWRPSELWLVHAHGVARAEGPRDRGRSAGLAEAFLQYRPELSPSVALRIRAGAFFPPTSRENVAPLWSSPYTLSYSALNAWIGEEMRLVGIETALISRSLSGNELQLAGTVFGGADTLGTLIGWRGFSIGDRLSVIGETLPLPPLASFGAGQPFAAQMRGTRAIDELDDRLGWQARARWSRAGRALLQAAYTDNRGDRELHGGQYAWRTRFGQAAAELQRGRFVLAAEGALGNTGMGARNGAHVEVRFRSGYLLASYGGESARVSARYDAFDNDDRDRTAEPGHETGSAWTLAAFWSPWRHLRFGAEWVDLRASRPAAAFSGADPNTDARRLSGELRLSF